MPELLEAVRPAHLWVPEHAVGSAGPHVAELAANFAGVDLDPEQCIALDALLAEDESGRWAAIEGAFIEPRQNGKTLALQMIALAGLFLFDDVRLIIWTAHQFSTAMEAFRDINDLVHSSPELSRRLKRVTAANGDEGFEVMGPDRRPRRLMFKARTGISGRGFTGDVVILDEAFKLSGAEMGTLMPTLSARPNPLVIYGSSAGLVGSEFLRGIRDRGRPGGDPSLVYVEWCAEEAGCATEECDHRYGAERCVLDDEDRWVQANPAVASGRISLRYLRAERRALPPAEFARERLGWWDEPAGTGAGIPEVDWMVCADRTAGIDEPCALAFDIDPGHLSASIVVCGGALHVAEHRYGTAWVIGHLQRLVAEHEVVGIGFDPAGPAGAMLPDLELAGFAVRSQQEPEGLLVPIAGREASQACESFLSAVVTHTAVHRDQQALNRAVIHAQRRMSGDSWRWSRRDSDVAISPLVAASNAWWLFSQPFDAVYRVEESVW